MRVHQRSSVEPGFFLKQGRCVGHFPDPPSLPP
jgi:hypothetical protein